MFELSKYENISPHCEGVSVCLFDLRLNPNLHSNLNPDYNSLYLSLSHTHTQKMRLRCLNNIIPTLPQNPLIPLALASLFSTKTLAPPSSFSYFSSSSSSSSSSSLYDRIQVIQDPKVSVVPVLEQWVNEGWPIQKQHLRSLVRLMKDFKRFNHALEVSL